MYPITVKLSTYGYSRKQRRYRHVFKANLERAFVLLAFACGSQPSANRAEQTEDDNEVKAIEAGSLVDLLWRLLGRVTT